MIDVNWKNVPLVILLSALGIIFIIPYLIGAVLMYPFEKLGDIID